MNLAVIGTTFLDIKGYPLNDFNPVGRNSGKLFECHGGVGRNIAEDIANMGENALLVSLVNKSGSAIGIVNYLKEHNVNVDHIRATDDGMGTWMAIFDNNGALYASISNRTDLIPICDILEEEGDEIYTWADAILLEIDMDEPVIAKAFELAAKYNKDVYCVISNMSIAMERLEYIKRSSCFVCNRIEAALLFNCPEDCFCDVATASATLKDKLPSFGLKSMVVTLDKDGAIYCDNNGDSGSCPAADVKVIDTTGAGDAFFAGVSIGLAGGKGLKGGCEIGNRMSGIVIQSEGNVYKQ